MCRKKGFSDPCSASHLCPPQSIFGQQVSALTLKPITYWLFSSCASCSGNSWIFSRSHLCGISSISTFISTCHRPLFPFSSYTPVLLQASMLSLHFCSQHVHSYFHLHASWCYVSIPSPPVTS